MGNDGGFLPKRKEMLGLVKEKLATYSYEDQNKDCKAEDALTLCALSKVRLK